MAAATLSLRRVGGGQVEGRAIQSTEARRTASTQGGRIEAKSEKRTHYGGSPRWMRRALTLSFSPTQAIFHKLVQLRSATVDGMRAHYGKKAGSAQNLTTVDSLLALRMVRCVKGEKELGVERERKKTTRPTAYQTHHDSSTRDQE